MIGDSLLADGAEVMQQKRHKLNIACKRTMRRSNNQSTRANHRTHYAAYVEFCNEYEFQQFPATTWRYCQFAQYLAWQQKKPGTIKNYVSTIRVLHRLQGYWTPDPGQIHYNKMILAFEKQRQEPVKQAAPMTHQVLLQLYEHVDFRSELQAVTWVSLLVGFTLVLRVSNLAPRTRTEFDPRKNLLRSDLQYVKGFWTVNIRWTKTIQTMNRTILAPLVPAAVKIICPQHWITRMIKLIPAEPQEPLFLVRQGHTRLPLAITQISRLLDKWCKAAGLDPGMYTPHCLRRGGLSWAHQAKVSGEALKMMGDWASNAYLRYIHIDFDSRVDTGRRMAEIAEKLVNKAHSAKKRIEN